MGHVEDCHHLNEEVTRFADVMTTLPQEREVATCPGWDVRDLAEHLGVIHRWAEQLVRRRSPQRTARDATAAAGERIGPEWIVEGGRQLVATLLAADPTDEMWAWGRDQHVRFWSRRQLHETLVHRMDLELAAGMTPVAEPSIAIDAIDEFLSNLATIAARDPALSKLRGSGERLGMRVYDSDVRWSITLNTDGFVVTGDEDDCDVEVESSSVDLLLVLLRRLPVAGSDAVVAGDRELFDFWLAHSSFD